MSIRPGLRCPDPLIPDQLTTPFGPVVSGRGYGTAHPARRHERPPVPDPARGRPSRSQRTTYERKPRSLEEVQGPEGVRLEVVERDRGREIVGGLCRGVDDGVGPDGAEGSVTPWRSRMSSSLWWKPGRSATSCCWTQRVSPCGPEARSPETAPASPGRAGETVAGKWETPLLHAMTNAETPTKETRAVAPLADRVPPGGTNDPDEILGLFLDWVADTGLTLYPAQEEALLEIMAGKHVILGTPTGSGKSLVALGLHFKALCEGQRLVLHEPDQGAREREVLRALRRARARERRDADGRREHQPRGGRRLLHGRGPLEHGAAPRRGARRAVRRDGRVPLLRRQGARRRLAGAAPRPAGDAVPPDVGDARRHVARSPSG